MGVKKKIFISTVSKSDVKSDSKVISSLSLQTDNLNEPAIKDVNLSVGDVGEQNGVKFKEGELVITSENNPSDISVWVDDNGFLFISGSDVENYSINNMGELVYNK